MRAFTSLIFSETSSARSRRPATSALSPPWPLWVSYITCPSFFRMSENSPFRSKSWTFSLATSTIWPAFRPATRAVSAAVSAAAEAVSLMRSSSSFTLSLIHI